VNFTLAEFAAACSGRLMGPDGALDSACIDSRLAGPGALFFALRGSRVDGHDFVDPAIAAGARAVVSEDRWSTGVVLVGSVGRAMLDGASALRSRIRVPVIAVTGSSGKTTTREMIRAALSPTLKAFSSPGNLNNSLGLPLSIMNMPADSEAGVFELGMSAAGELTVLGGVARPDCTVVTNIGTAHIEFLGSREGIAAAKAELLLQTRQGGLCVIPVGEPILEEAASRRGLEPLRAGRGGDIWLEAEGEGFTALPWGVPLRLDGFGPHLRADALMALGVACRMGVPPDLAAAALEGFHPMHGRGEELAIGDLTILDESYNANPDSMIACLEALGERRGRKGAVLGDMLELGGFGRAAHEDVLRKADSIGLESLILVGPSFRRASAVLRLTPFSGARSWEDALGIVRKLAGPLTLLVKGSHAVQLDRLVGALVGEGGCSTGCCTR